MRYFMLILFFGFSLYAESQGTAPTGPTGANNLNPNTLQAFDGDFFNPKKSDANSPPTTIGGRAAADAPDYNTDTRKEALGACSGLKEKNFPAWQKCYADKMNESRQKVQEAQIEVEKKQQIPLKNYVNPLIEEQTRNGASDGEDD